MPTNNSAPASSYDPRWFIWTIVFLFITGVSLVSYIIVSDSGEMEFQDVARAKVRTSQTK